MGTIQRSNFPQSLLICKHTELKDSETRWQARRGPLVSLALHAAVIAAFIVGSSHAPKRASLERTFTLVIEKPAPEPLRLARPNVEPAPGHAVERKIAPSHPVRAQRAPQPRIVTVPAALAQVSAPAARPVAAASAAVAADKPMDVPATPSGPAAVSGSAAPRVIGQEGIPSDYVNLVFARINRSAADHYSRMVRFRQFDGRVGYRLTLAPDGSVIRCDIDSSGDSTLDAAATEAIRAAAPFPHLPDPGGSSYVLQGAIVYEAE
jgi:protein TonB